MLYCCTTCISWEIGSYNTQQSRHNEHTHFCREIRNMIFQMRGGSKAVWNFSENSSVLETPSVPYGEHTCLTIFDWQRDRIGTDEQKWHDADLFWNAKGWNSTNISQISNTPLYSQCNGGDLDPNQSNNWPCDHCLTLTLRQVIQAKSSKSI